VRSEGASSGKLTVPLLPRGGKICAYNHFVVSGSLADAPADLVSSRPLTNFWDPRSESRSYYRIIGYRDCNGTKVEPRLSPRWISARENGSSYAPVCNASALVARAKRSCDLFGDSVTDKWSSIDSSLNNPLLVCKRATTGSWNEASAPHCREYHAACSSCLRAMRVARVKVQARYMAQETCNVRNSKRPPWIRNGGKK